MSRTFISYATEQLQLARRYTHNLLEAIPSEQWFAMPSAGVSHIAWQAGHIAMADYRLLLERIRGYETDDEQLISSEFLKTFSKGTVPVADPHAYPSVDVILDTLHRVREQALDELVDVTDAQLQAPPHRPHQLFNTQMGSITWASRHEMLHAGQIGLIRRQLGGEPLR